MLQPLDYHALQPRDWMRSNPTLVFAKELADQSMDTNILYFLSLPKKTSSIYAVFEGLGNIGGYFDQFGEIFSLYDGSVENYLMYRDPLL